MTLYKFLFILLFVLTTLLNSKAQSKDTISAYVFSDTSRFHKIEDVLKIGRIFLSDTNVTIKKFAWVFAGSILDPSFGLNDGLFFTSDLITDLKKHDSVENCMIMFQQFIVFDKRNPNREIFVKPTAYLLKKY